VTPPPTAEDVLDRFARSRALFTALGDERRQTIIVLLLRAGEALSVNDIAARLELSQPAASHHLKILRDAGLLTVERKGTQRRYALNAAEYPERLAPLGELVELIVACSSAPHA
jgi:ArsR family transcriptional regulator, arsenate/arsenite/antimonite-responsive transcriptional repressor